jgi:hypothetical protein
LIQEEEKQKFDEIKEDLDLTDYLLSIIEKVCE